MSELRDQTADVPADVVADAVATVPPAANSAQALAALFGGEALARFCSFDPKTPAGIMLLDKCEESPDQRLREITNVKLALVHVYGHLVDVIHEETGTVQSRLRTCLIDKSGQVYACVSEGIRKSVVRLVTQHGLPPWPAGVPVIVKVRVLANGHNWLYLTNDPEAQPAKKVGKP